MSRDLKRNDFAGETFEQNNDKLANIRPSFTGLCCLTMPKKRKFTEEINLGQFKEIN